MIITLETKKSIGRKCIHLVEDQIGSLAAGYASFDIGYCNKCKNFVIQIGDCNPWEVINTFKTKVK